MTANQINYAKLVEDRRHNRLTEGEAYRHNVESERTNKYAAGAGYYSAGVNAAHFARQDEISWYTAKKQGDVYDKQSDYYSTMAEKLGSEVGVEAGKLDETQRHNEATEGIQSTDVGEKARHNEAVESETQRSNMVEELETNRHNEETERAHRDEIALDTSTNIRQWVDTLTGSAMRSMVTGLFTM